jgi:hypothetical protein
VAATAPAVRLPSPSAARRAVGLAGDLRIQIFGALFGLGTVHHELQFILEQYRTGPFENYMERWSALKPTIGWSTEVGIALHLVDLLLGALLVILPWRRALLMALAVSFALTNLVSPERIPSHNSLWLGALAVILIFGLAEIVERAGPRAPGDGEATDWYGWTLKGLTWLCALTYFFAAFHKLNPTFLTLATSTAPPFILLLVEPFGIPRDAALPLLGPAVIYGTIATEASLPLLLMGRRTRLLGCLVGLVFHLAMMARGIFDFPVSILAFYPLFMSREEARALLARHLTRPSPVRLAIAVLVAIGGAVTLGASEYVRNLHVNAANFESVVLWAHGALLYATFFLFAYVITTVGAMLFDRRPAAVLAPSAA